MRLELHPEGKGGLQAARTNHTLQVILKYAGPGCAPLGWVTAFSTGPRVSYTLSSSHGGRNMTFCLSPGTLKNEILEKTDPS